MRKFTTLGLSVAALAATGWLFTAQAQEAAPPADASAPAADASAPAPKAHHKAHKKPAIIHRGADGGDAAVDDLNARSLTAAKTGAAFTPPAKPTPAKAPVKPSKMKHHAKKPAAPAAAK